MDLRTDAEKKAMKQAAVMFETMATAFSLMGMAADEAAQKIRTELASIEPAFRSGGVILEQTGEEPILNKR